MNSSNLAQQLSISSAKEFELSFSSLIFSKEFIFQSLNEASNLSIEIAALCPFPKRVELGLNEVFINAIEHGNLDIHYTGGSELYGQEVRFHKIEKLLELPEHKDKYVKVHLQKNPTYILVTVTDQGKGFDYEKYMKSKVQKSTLPCGRGIYLAKFFSFDNLEYSQNGTVAKCFIHLN